MHSKADRLPRFFQFIGASALLVLMALVFIILMMLHTAMVHEMPMEFESKKWKESAPAGKAVLKDSNIRYRMHKSLMTKHSLVGMTRKQVHSLLGPSDVQIRDDAEIHRYHMSVIPDLTYLDVHIENDLVTRAVIGSASQIEGGAAID